MRALILALVPAAGVIIGIAMGRHTRPPLDKTERKELESLRSLRDDLAESASEHATLGDPFGTIALAKIREARNRSNRK